ncbi:acyl-CoA dehydrogenase [Rhizobium leguminosarum bv. trifolii]|uniref:Acyl-CoA dehydrogenase n=2 Tax=Rhizobium TaxID=379 RepID=A0A3E1B812_RHILT|nr:MULTISPECIES: acyl-CoA dehydrogenase family protein [Rhizobium]KPH04967.1 acyl-CoA dehydrogenase [Rhizobium acidisoli]QAS81020.1 acyl-CoA dehydrogenase [Rhizobium acidisoli]RFB86424.1 acyl-CoA dehydrogenase [Rhizobium leguminosarum bv. trifolii]RFB86683.1 acyl-CoA dehydrogenase [Rhizobium leguminosarum bv. trifolii]RFB87133.1 acyl-CoA dehydrogenase [Rhizobium leguminosarum bv. trifolii]
MLQEPIDPVGKARRLAVDFAERAAHFDATGEFPFENFTHLYEAGLLGLVTAREHGGFDGGLVEAQAVISEIARGEPSTALVLAMHYNSHYGLRRFGKWPEHLAQRILSANRLGPALLNAAQAEPRIGSPAHGALPETIARRDGDRWRITGRKTYVTGIPILKWVSLLALTDEPEPRLASFLVPTDSPGLRIEKTWNAAGMHATASDDIILDDVVIPFSDVIEAQPASEPIRREEHATAFFFSLIGAVYHGVALSARDRVLSFAARHAPASLGAPIATVPRIQDGLGEIEVRLATSARLLRSLGEDVDAGKTVGMDGMNVRHVVIDNSVAVTSLALDLAGNPGLNRDFQLERQHRDAMTARSHAPQNHMIRTIAAKNALARLVATGI